MRVLHVVSSPRGDDSASTAVAHAFLDALRAHRSDLEIDTLDVWAADLPELDPERVATKYKLVSGEALGAVERDHVRRVEALIARVRAAERIVMSAPMWNWSMPYKLKQFIDLVCLRDRLFTFAGDAYAPALDVPRGLLVTSRGQSTRVGMSGPPAQPADYHVDYLRFWLQMIGVREVEVLAVEDAWRGRADLDDDGVLAAARRRAADF